jgi:hypothetical protein
MELRCRRLASTVQASCHTVALAVVAVVAVVAVAVVVAAVASALARAPSASV